ncbi:hypothetical protein ASF34_03190 [Methylobacterium sp. Leaf106]|nr:hypothetical protein ASF34_03190 [Methylobacterium sp. Leaf106]
MRMIVPVVVSMVVTALTVVVSLAFGLESPRNRGRGATLPTDQFGIGRGRGYIEDVCTDLRRDVVAAELPGQPQQASRILRPYFEQGFRRSANGHQAPVFETKRVTVLDGGSLRQRQSETHTARAGEDRGCSLAFRMVESHGIRHGIRANGGFADDGGGTQHGFLETVLGFVRASGEGRPRCLACISRGFSA